MNKASEINIENIDVSAPEFQSALTLLTDTNRSVFLTGRAGTGKSTFLRYLTATTKKKFVVLAPTGIAAVNAGGQTLHSFFKLPFKPMLPDDPEISDKRRLKQRMRYGREHVKLLREIQLIIIDEISMVRADTIDFIDRILKTYTGNFREPFGGKQLLMVGDVFQLEPVITGDMRDVLSHYYRDGMFFFNALAFADAELIPIELTKVYRQTDATFIAMLDRMRTGTPAPADIQYLNTRVSAGAIPDDMVMTLASRRDTVDSINETRLSAIHRPERTFTGTIQGDFPETSLPTDKVLTLKEGAQVVFVKNDPSKRWVNGTIGRIADFGEAEILIELADGSRHAVEPEVWGNIKYEYNEEKCRVDEKGIGTFTQYPIKLAWAITIHKSQGLTFDKVVIDLGHGAFSGGQTYVALSRCRSLEGIILRSTINQRDIFVNPRVMDFSRRFNNSMLISRALDAARAATCYREGVEAFNSGDFSRAVRLLSEAISLRPSDVRQPANIRLAAMKLHRLTSAREQIEDLKTRIEKYEKKLLRLATEYVELGEQCRTEGWDISAALRNYDKAIDLAPGYSYAWLSKGLALAQTGNLDDAISYLDQASECDGKDFRPLLEAGRLLLGQGDVPVAMDYLLRALALNCKSKAVHLALAEGYDLAGDTVNAEKHRRQAKKYK